LLHPAIDELINRVSEHPEFRKLCRELGVPALGVGRSFALSGLTLTAKGLYLALLWKRLQQPLLVLGPGPQAAEELAECLQTFLRLVDPAGPAVELLPAFDVLPGQGLSVHGEIAERRAVALWALAEGRASITVAPVEAALFRLRNPEAYRNLALRVHVGAELRMEDLLAHLEQVGYERRDPVELAGEYAVRGGIVDVFPPRSPRPFRIEFFGDWVDSIRQFDVATQRSVREASECLVLPLTETPRQPGLLAELSEKLGNLIEADGWPAGWEFLVPLLRPHQYWVGDFHLGWLVLDEPEELEKAAERFWKRLSQQAARSGHRVEANCLTLEEFEKKIRLWDRLLLREKELPAAGYELAGTRCFHIRSEPAPAFQGNVPALAGEIEELARKQWQVLLLAPAAGELERLSDICCSYNIPHQLATGLDQVPEHLANRPFAGASAWVFLARGKLRKGVFLPESRLALLSMEDLFGALPAASIEAAPRPSMGAFAADLGDLKPGDFVVHSTHGIGRFVGLCELSHDGQQGEFVVLEYAEGAKLYVPVTRLDLIQKYRAAGDARPQLDRLGGTTWTRTKKRVKARIQNLAKELLRLYAERELAEGFAYSPDGPWQREFEAAFEYEETPDQLTAIREIKRDMERPRPMDRLLCGDVGYGKTEVAMRAAFKALADGKQVAVLAPTTVLCLQHYQTFRRRFAPFPVRIEMLSRLRPPQQIRQVLEDLASGKVDIVIGTHRLLSDDVQFRDLGLLIIDEEQRFGVRHKERLKALRKNIDVLTMTATPIPRTLHMALLGLRDLSVIQTPPKDRLAIHTTVARFDPELVRFAIEQELARGGQIYYLHNRVESIWSRAAFLQELVPQCRLAVAHGQMSEAALEKVLLGFMRHEFDMLVCTTIVENGLDIPLANTIIVENAHRYGLAELYQLRGRVGRSNRRAYAYLLVPEDAELSETARKRLAALREFSELGAGFKIAALDLELRGAGNLLGAEQHGHINAVGYDTYVRLLEQAVQELRGEPVRPEIHTSLNLGLQLRIPASYVADDQQRLRLYKRIADLRQEAEAQQLLEELADRYGPPPEEVRRLVQLALLKSWAEAAGIERIQRQHGAVSFKFHPETTVSPERLMQLVRSVPGAQFTPDGTLRLPLSSLDGDAALRLVQATLETLVATTTPS